MFNTQIQNQFNCLRSIIDNYGGNVEGNLICYKTTDNLVIERNKDKILNLQEISKDKNSICEIGVNAGHSLLLMLNSNPYAEYTLFDINVHLYTEPCLQYIKTQFPSTSIEIIFGDSRETLPEFIAKNKNKKFEMIHVDGGHENDIVKKDFYNTLKLIEKSGVIIFDDYNLKNIKNFLDRRLENEICKVSDKSIIENKYHLIYTKHEN